MPELFAYVGLSLGEPRASGIGEANGARRAASPSSGRLTSKIEPRSLKLVSETNVP